jgi:hypothetical protein
MFTPLPQALMIRQVVPPVGSIGLLVVRLDDVPELPQATVAADALGAAMARTPREQATVASAVPVASVFNLVILGDLLLVGFLLGRLPAWEKAITDNDCTSVP